MPDLDHLLDTLVTVSARTRAPGASTAIKQARRRRAKVAVAAATAAVASIAVVGGLAAGPVGGSDQPSPIGEPTTPSPEPSTTAGSPTASPELPAGQEEASVGERYRTLRKTLTSVSGWAVTDAAVGEPTALNRCEGNWMDGPGGRGAGHNLGLSVSPDEPPVAWAEEVEGFTSPAQASDAMDQFIANLASCTAESWRSQPIGQTGAVLAFTDAGVLWVHQRGGSVAALYVATIDGPPPLAVQVEVADLIYSWFG